MSATYLSLNVHIIFATKDRTPTIDLGWRPELHAYIGGTIKGLGGIPFAVGGVADHVHVVAGIKATHSVADLVRELKKMSSVWAIERYHRFAWQVGYAAFSFGRGDLGDVVKYVMNQEDHHRKLSSSDELRQLLAEFDVAYDPKYFE